MCRYVQVHTVRKFEAVAEKQPVLVFDILVCPLRTLVFQGHVEVALFRAAGEGNRVVHEIGVAHEVFLVFLSAVGCGKGVQGGVTLVYVYLSKEILVQRIFMREDNPVIISGSVCVVLDIGPFVCLGVEYLSCGFDKLLAGHLVHV